MRNKKQKISKNPPAKLNMTLFLIKNLYPKTILAIFLAIILYFTVNYYQIYKTETGSVKGTIHSKLDIEQKRNEIVLHIEVVPIKKLKGKNI